MATNNQYCLEKILESLREMRELLGFKTEPKHDRTVLICGAAQDDDCLCVVAESLVQSQLLDPVIKDNGDEAFKEKIVDPIYLNNQVGEPLKQVKAQSDLTQILTEHEQKVLICGYTEAEDCFCVATEVMKSEYDLDVVDVEFFANLKEFHVASEVFDESPERDGYIPTLDPKPPDECGPLLCISTIEFHFEEHELKIDKKQVLIFDPGGQFKNLNADEEFRCNASNKVIVSAETFQFFTIAECSCYSCRQTVQPLALMALFFLKLLGSFGLISLLNFHIYLLLEDKESVRGRDCKEL